MNHTDCRPSRGTTQSPGVEVVLGGQLAERVEDLQVRRQDAASEVKPEANGLSVLYMRLHITVDYELVAELDQRAGEQATQRIHRRVDSPRTR